MKKYLLAILLLATQWSHAQTLDIQGHRGARGLLPENTIPAFLRALDEGVTTLELDVVITKDNQVVISHEPYMSGSICSKPDGSPVESDESQQLNIYQMTYEEVKAFDCGSRGNKRFPEQQKMTTVKPLLIDMIKAVEEYLVKNNLSKVGYNIELKSSPSREGVYHPQVNKFSDIVQRTIAAKLSKDRYTIQCFDFRVLQYFHKTYPEVSLVALVENRKGVKANIADLGFVPQMYSPNFRLISKKDIAYCHQRGMKVVPWTVNTVKNMQQLVEKGVDGIITDYPDRAKELTK
ncbi:MAG: glycerophosphodiester phosphodiesterase [Roseivirga sp.]|nr:glycerophosphodiester phosphodiesterase [Roseivirga sp.]